MAMHVRLKPYNPKRGHLLRRYTVFGIRFECEKGWYEVDDDIAIYLKTVHQDNNDPDSKDAFDVCTLDEAKELDRKERRERLRRGETVAMPVTMERDDAGAPNMAGKRASAKVVGHNVDITDDMLDDDEDFEDGEDLAPSLPEPRAANDLTTADLPRTTVKKSKPASLTRKRTATKKTTTRKPAAKKAKKTSRRAASKKG